MQSAQARTALHSGKTAIKRSRGCAYALTKTMENLRPVKGESVTPHSGGFDSPTYEMPVMIPPSTASAAEGLQSSGQTLLTATLGVLNLMEKTMTYFPQWVDQYFVEITDMLEAKASFKVDEAVATICRYEELLKKAPHETTIGEIYDVSPRGLQPLSRDALEGMLICLELMSSRWVCEHQMKSRCLWDGITQALSQANFVVAATCLRSFFEEVAVFAHQLAAIAPVTEKLKTHLGEFANMRKKKKVRDQWMEKFIKLLLPALKKLSNAMQGGGQDWATFIRETAGDYGLELKQNIEPPKKTHISDGVRSLTKNGFGGAEKYYSILSELVHPNLGSKTLIIRSRDPHGSTAGDLHLATNPKNFEAAAWFYELSLEETASLCNVAAQNVKTAGRYATFFQRSAIQWSRAHDLVSTEKGAGNLLH